MLSDAVAYLGHTIYTSVNITVQTYTNAIAMRTSFTSARLESDDHETIHWHYKKCPGMCIGLAVIVNYVENLMCA